MNGKSIKVDVEKTVKDYYQGDVNGRWYGIPVIIECGAKEYNIAEAQYLLGISYMEGIDRNKNIDEGMKWLKKAADQFLPEAMGEFGSYCSDFGKKELAEKYYRLAIDNGPKGQARAIHNLNILLVNQYRYAEAMQLLKLGVEKYHDSYCMGTLGVLLYSIGSLCNNNPSQQDKNKAIELFKQGASLGDKRSIEMLNEINGK